MVVELIIVFILRIIYKRLLNKYDLRFEENENIL